MNHSRERVLVNFVTRILCFFFFPLKPLERGVYVNRVLRKMVGHQAFYYHLSRLCSFLELKESGFEEPNHFYVGLLIL